MYKTETHLHTADVSACGWIDAAEMVRLYHEKGYKTVFVSDHFYKRYMDKFPNLSWSEKVDEFLKSYENAKRMGDELGVNVILSAEIEFVDFPNHYLIYGIDRAFLEGCLDVFNMGIEKYYEYAKAHGVFVVQAHPLRDGKCIPTPDFVDAFEVYNSNPRHENFDKETEKMAKNSNMPITAGSDSHRLEDIGLTGIITKDEIKTAEDYIRAVKSGNIEIIKVC